MLTVVPFGRVARLGSSMGRLSWLWRNRFILFDVAMDVLVCNDRTVLVLAFETSSKAVRGAEHSVPLKGGNRSTSRLLRFLACLPNGSGKYVS